MPCCKKSLTNTTLYCVLLIMSRNIFLVFHWCCRSLIYTTNIYSLLHTTLLYHALSALLSCHQPPVVSARQPVRPRSRGHHADPPQPGPQQCQSHGHLRRGRHPPHPQSTWQVFVEDVCVWNINTPCHYTFMQLWRWSLILTFKQVRRYHF